jgi:hypothetical protein
VPVITNREVAEPDHESTSVLPHHSSSDASISLPISTILTRQLAVVPENDNEDVTEVAAGVTELAITTSPPNNAKTIITVKTSFFKKNHPPSNKLHSIN